jgi:hypothetical protein
VLRCVSGVVGEGDLVRDCRGIGKMGIMCKFGIVDHSVSSEGGGGRGSRVKGRRRREG